MTEMIHMYSSIFQAKYVLHANTLFRIRQIRSRYRAPYLARFVDRLAIVRTELGLGGGLFPARLLEAALGLHFVVGHLYKITVRRLN